MQFLKTLFEYWKDEIGINNKNHTASTPHHSTTIDRSPSANIDANIVKKDMINEMIENVMCEIKDIETIMRDLDCEGYEYEYICKVQPYLYHLYK